MGARKLAALSDQPLMRSESFNLNSIVQMRMDFYPNGIDARVYQEGVSTVRFYAPKGSKFKYEVSIGRVCDGTKIFDTSQIVTQCSDAELKEGFWIDLHFPAW